MTVGELQKVLAHLQPDVEVRIRIRNGDGPCLFHIKDIKDVAARFLEPDGKPQLHVEV